ncbi:MAG: FAD-dependent oxidoreductase, partial [Deltaproteobacteria bacterium]|nr:FAD-dependent oxidoreductase [Deltaproteobacteria bacterium]
AVKRLRGGVEQLLKAAGVEIVRGEGLPDGERAIRVGDRRIEARNVVVATGSEPVRLPIPGADLPGVLDSTGVLALESCPKSVVIIGGGVIGVEFADLFASLNVPVTILEVMDGILSGMDGDVTKQAAKGLQKKGVAIRTGARVAEIVAGNPKTVRYTWNGGRHEVAAALVVMAAGRRPVAGVAAGWGLALERGAIVVDEYLRTSAPGIYAVGDCTGKVQLAHVASAQGLTAATHAAGKPAVPMRYDIIPACVYTEPEIACVGISKDAAALAGREVRCGSFPIAANGKSSVMEHYEGFCRLVTDAQTGEILGAQIVAPRATDMIAAVAAVMRCEGTIEDLAETIHPHPTVSEIIMEAAHDVEGLCVHKP